MDLAQSRTKEVTALGEGVEGRGGGRGEEGRGGEGRGIPRVYVGLPIQTWGVGDNRMSLVTRWGITPPDNSTAQVTFVWHTTEIQTHFTIL